MKLIIAEKPSLARNIAKAIGAGKNKNGYIQCGEYLVSWAFGHLFSLCDIEDYTGPTSSGHWSMENIPCFPKEFKFKLRASDKGIKKQFDTVESLCNSENVTEIINAGDADREGEIIVRLLIEHALKGTKPIKRLWLPDQTDRTILAALAALKDDSEYDNLAAEGFARTYADWLYGVNLTRYATLKAGTLLRVGRVIVPIVKAIYDRDTAIKNFVPTKYFVAASDTLNDGIKVELISKKRFFENDTRRLLRLCEAYNKAPAVVTDVKSKKDTLKPSKLFSLSKLQNLLGKKYKMPMDESLKTVQTLYENGYVTYPRTNSEYLALAEKDKIKDILEIVKNLGYPVKFKDSKTIFDDKKIESHSALTPTYKIPKKENLTENERLVYSTIMRRFVAVFCSEECIAQKTEIKIKVGEYEEFTLKGTVILRKGWTKYDEYSKQDKVLPQFKTGDEVLHDFKPKERVTTPPKHYTIETLNNYLKNPFKEEKAGNIDAVPDEYDDEEDYKAIFEGLELGTEATRTGIIENAIKSKYIDLKKDVYYILKDGEYLIESLTKMGIEMDKYKTSTLGRALKKVYKGELETDGCVLIAKKEIESIFDRKDLPPEEDTDTGFYGDKVGVCPICGGEVTVGRYAYGCNNYKNGCKFKINTVICRRVISKKNAEMLLKDGRTSKIRGFISKNGKPFDAFLVLNGDKAEFKF